MIRVKDLCKDYGYGDILSNVSFDIADGEVIALVGASGCGKSTLLRCIIGLEPITGGNVFIDDMDTSAGRTEALIAKKKIGMVFQQFNLFSHLMVVENVMLGPVNILKIDKQTAYEEAMHILESVGLAGSAYKYPHELSGGQQQRVAIARTIAMKPEIILFDEPTSALDPTMVGEVQSVIKKFADEGMTMIISTHDMDFAKKIATRVMYMDEKGIYEDGTPEQIFLAPKKPKTGKFLYRISNFNYHIDGNNFDLFNFQAQMAAFLHKQSLAEKRIRIHQLVSEEILIHLFFTRNGAKSSVADYSVSYSAEFDTSVIRFESELIGEDFVEHCDDDLAMMIIGKYANDFKSEHGVLTVHMKSSKELKAEKNKE